MGGKCLRELPSGRASACKERSYAAELQAPGMRVEASMELGGGVALALDGFALQRYHFCTMQATPFSSVILAFPIEQKHFQPGMVWRGAHPYGTCAEVHRRPLHPQRTVSTCSSPRGSCGTCATVAYRKEEERRNHSSQHPIGTRSERGEGAGTKQPVRSGGTENSTLT